MTLKEAVKKVLTEHGGVLTVEEICRRIKDGNLFVKSDGTSPDPSYVLYGVKNYLDQFEVIIGIR